MDHSVRRASLRARRILPVLALMIGGCPNSELAPIEPCTVSGVFDSITRGGNDNVDLLFVIDDSSSMAFEQDTLASALPELVRSLASGEIRDADGKVTQRFTPVKSLHLGVVSSDMGVNGVEEGTAVDACGLDAVNKPPRSHGDDGLLLSTPYAKDPTCTEPDAAYLRFESQTDDPDALGKSFGCITRLGTNGCGYEQQLEAMWKALAPASNTSFSRGTAGHGDAENAGFLRENSVIAVIHVSDEEDCSIPDSALDVFNPEVQGENKNISCQRNRNELHPADRFIEGLKFLRRDNPDQVVFAAIVGVPVEPAETLVKADGSQDFDALLALEEMQFEAVRDDKERLVPRPACSFKGADAYPARRFVEVAKGFGKNGIVRSICQADFTSALSAITAKIANQLEGACLERTLIADPSTHLAPCGLVEYLPTSKTSPDDCDEGKGRRFLKKRKEGGAEYVVCQINQLAVDKGKANCDAQTAAGETNPMDCLSENPNSPDALDNPRITSERVGWYYDDFSRELKESAQCNAQRIAFTEGAEQATGSQVRFECLQPVFSVFANARGAEAVNKPCEGMTDVCSEAADDNYPGLFCDPSQNTCQIACEEDANCPDSWICDKTRDAPICLNPTCPPQ